MEVRVIDPKTDNDQNAGKVLGTVIRLVRPARHSPAPNPYRFLIDKALEAGKVDTVTEAECRVAKDQFCTNVRIAPDPSANEGVNKQWQDQKFGTTKGIFRNEDQEAKGGLAQAGLSGVSQRQATGQVQVVRPRSTPASLSESSHHAGEVVHRHPSHKLDAKVVFVGPPATSPYFITKDDSGKEVWWNPKSKSYEVKNHQNAEAAEATYPPSNSLFDKSGISSSSARPAPNSTEPTDLGTGFSRDHGLPPVDRGLSPNRGVRHLFSRFIDKIVEHSAYNDPSREMTNFGWRKRA